MNCSCALMLASSQFPIPCLSNLFSWPELICYNLVVLMVMIVDDFFLMILIFNIFLLEILFHSKIEQKIKHPREWKINNPKLYDTHKKLCVVQHNAKHNKTQLISFELTSMGNTLTAMNEYKFVENLNRSYWISLPLSTTVESKLKSNACI